MNTPTASLIDWDREFLWHPFTPMKPWCERKDIVVIERGEAEFLIDTEGRRYLDGVSSMWCNVHGHCVPALDNAVRDQLANIAHSSLLGLANVPSILLAKRLIELVRRSHLALDKVFYSDNGSTAVEVACKMAHQYWRNTSSPALPTEQAHGLQALGTSRNKFIALASAYHGDTLGAVSLGGIPTFHAPYQPLTFPVDFVPSPLPSKPAVSDGAGQCAPTPATTLQTLDSLLTQHPTAYAAIIIEPLVQGAGGMLMHPPSFLHQLRQLATRHNTLLIADEVMTGFGRTGKMFACEHAPITPDLLCLSKGLTAGYMPLGVTMTTQKIFDAFYADPRAGKTFFHGHTFTGHPLACAVALASLDLFDQTHLLDHVHTLQPILAETMDQARASPYVADARHCGLIGAIDLHDPRTGQPFPYHWRIGGALCTRMRSLGLMMRPLADTLVLMPPLAIREENFRRLCAGVLQSLTWMDELLEDTLREAQP
jgi:adenosylmethionine-8-amino-7-oxononanoate aminotransferase